MTMKNSFDRDINFESLEEAKKYFNDANAASLEDSMKNPESVLVDFEDFVGGFKEYMQEIDEASDLEELAEVLNRYSDVYGNGSTMYVEEV